MFDKVCLFGIPVDFNLKKLRENILEHLRTKELKLVTTVNGIECYEDSSLPPGEMRLYQGQELITIITGIKK